MLQQAQALAGSLRAAAAGEEEDDTDDDGNEYIAAKRAVASSVNDDVLRGGALHKYLFTCSQLALEHLWSTRTRITSGTNQTVSGTNGSSASWENYGPYSLCLFQLTLEYL